MGHTFLFHLHLREPEIQNVGSLWWSLTCKHFQHRGSEGIHVHLHRKILAFTVVGLFYGRIAWRARPNGCAALWLSVFVILLRQTEVDKYGGLLICHHHVCRLHIEVKHTFRVHAAKGRTNLSYYTHRLVSRQPTLSRDKAVKALTVDILHDIIGCAIGAEGINYHHDIIVAQPAEVVALLFKFTLVIVEHALTVTACHSRAFASIDVAHKKLLYAEQLLHLVLTHNIFGKVGYAKRPLSQSLQQHVAIVASLQNRAYWKSALCSI